MYCTIIQKIYILVYVNNALLHVTRRENNTLDVCLPSARVRRKSDTEGSCRTRRTPQRYSFRWRRGVYLHVCVLQHNDTCKQDTQLQKNWPPSGAQYDITKHTLQCFLTLPTCAPSDITSYVRKSPRCKRGIYHTKTYCVATCK